MVQEVLKAPQEAPKFIKLLLEERPWQRNLAAQLQHQLTAYYWEYTTALAQITPPRYIEFKSKKQKGQNPNQQWQAQFTQINQTIISAEQQSNIGLRLKAYQKVQHLLKEFAQINLGASFKSRQAYTPVIAHLQKICTQEIADIQLEAANVEPISINPYRKGEALSPNYDKAIFRGRQDIKDKIAQQVLSATSFPLFVVQGQRRVGKSSLIRFLPSLLGSRFKIVAQDLQNAAQIRAIPSWLSSLRTAFNQSLSLTEETPWIAPTNWLDAWQEFETYISQVAEKQNYKIILAIDEYEELQNLLKEDFKNAEKLLKAMRHFSQHQRQVVFMFVGAAYMSELKQPTWSKFFVQSVPLNIDYLSKVDSLSLITQPVPEYTLKYTSDLPKRIYELTQGHPQLLHYICSKLTDLANREIIRTAINANHLDKVLQDIEEDTQPFSVFWIEFCEDLKIKETVVAICQGQAVSNKKIIRHLEKHRYIIPHPDKNGAFGWYKMRVPLFERWVLDFGIWDVA